VINPETVTATIRKCLFQDNELPAENQEAWAKENGVIVQGLVRTFAFHKGRLEESRSVIREMISNLPDTFDEGWSFLNMCNDKEGNQWTGMQTTMEELACLGEAVGVFKCLAPREMWTILPGGVPYYQRTLTVVDRVRDLSPEQCRHG
jgi:hypothetical protein